MKILIKRATKMLLDVPIQLRYKSVSFLSLFAFPHLFLLLSSLFSSSLSRFFLAFISLLPLTLIQEDEVDQSNINEINGSDSLPPRPFLLSPTPFCSLFFLSSPPLPLTPSTLFSLSSSPSPSHPPFLPLSLPPLWTMECEDFK